MKKIMILVLSLAVLFGFAACDNSSSTPDEDVSGVTDGVVVELAKSVPTDINALLDSTKGAFTSAKLTVTDGALAEEYTLGSGYSSITYATEQEAEGQRPAIGESLTLSGQASTSTDGNTVTVTLREYTYTFTDAQLGLTDNYVTVSGSVSGYLEGTMTVTLTAGKNNTKVLSKVAISDAKAIIPNAEADVAITYDGETVPSSDFIAYANGTNAATGNAIVTYAKWREDALSTARGEIDTVIKALLNLNSGSGTKTFISNFATVKTEGANVATGKYAAGTDGKGTATINWALGTDAKPVKVAEAAASGCEIYLVPGQDLELALTGTYASNTVDATSYKLSGTFNVYATFDTAAENGMTSTNTKAYEKFASIAVEIGGTAACDVTVSADGNNNVTAVTGTFTNVTSGTATATMKVGPAYNADGYDTESVVRTYTEATPYTGA